MKDKIIQEIKEYISEYMVDCCYDLSAVLNAIDYDGNENYQILLERFGKEFLIFTENIYDGDKVEVWGDNHGWIPNKPLKLFTKEENKNLLILLRKLLGTSKK